jgi:hypothetical protein
MSLTLDPAERLKRAIGAVRTFIRDKREINRLLLGTTESSDPDIQQALYHAIVKWNTTPPLIGASDLANFPIKPWLVEMAAIYTIRSALLWHAREHMPSSDGGTSADDHAKAGEYSGWLDRLEGQVVQQMREFKEAQNIAAALGAQGLSSEYAYAGLGAGTFNVFGVTNQQDMW